MFNLLPLYKCALGLIFNYKISWIHYENNNFQIIPNGERVGSGLLSQKIFKLHWGFHRTSTCFLVQVICLWFHELWSGLISSCILWVSLTFFSFGQQDESLEQQCLVFTADSRCWAYIVIVIGTNNKWIVGTQVETKNAGLPVLPVAGVNISYYSVITQ